MERRGGVANSDPRKRPVEVIELARKFQYYTILYFNMFSFSTRYLGQLPISCFGGTVFSMVFYYAQKIDIGYSLGGSQYSLRFY